MLMRAQGVNCEIELHDHHLVIKRTGLFAATSTLGGDKSVPLSSITSVQFKRSGFMSPGFLKFAILGEVEPAWDKLIHPNIVGFRKSQEKAFEQLRDRIQAAINVPSLASLAADHMRNRIDHSRDSDYEASQPRRLEGGRRIRPDAEPASRGSAFDDIPPWQPRSVGQWWRELSGGSKIVVAVVVVVLILLVTTSGTDNAVEADPAVEYIDESGNATSPPEESEAIAAADDEPDPAPPSLGEHVGQTPSDEIRGTSFWNQSAVFELVGRVIEDPTMAKMILGGGVEGKISQNGEWIRAYACMPHNCDRLNWSVVIKADGTAGAVCYHNEDDNRDGWYDGEAVLSNDGNCMP